MGSFDTFIDGRVEAQSKAFGKGLRTYHPGDRVEAARAPMSAEEAELWNRGEPLGQPPATGTYQAVGISTTSERDGYPLVYINIVDDVFVGIQLERDASMGQISPVGEASPDL